MAPVASCPLHPEEPFTATCAACGRVFCGRCASNLPGPPPGDCPTCKRVETTAFFDAAEEIDRLDLF